MLYFRRCLFALITPWGRLPPVTFAALALLVIACHSAIQMYLTSMGEDLPPYNAWSMSLFIALWCAFCLTSRRFHDSGKTALFLVPLMIVTFASYLSVFDDMHLASSVFEEDRNALRWAERLRLALQLTGMGAMIAALVRPGDEGDNAFGAMFYDSKAIAARHAQRAAHRSADKTKPKAADRIHAVTHAPVAAARVAYAPATDDGGGVGGGVDAAPHPKRRADDRPGLGPRGRITPGDTGRHRSEGFGRR